MASDMKLITLISSDGHPLDVPEAAALMSGTIQNLVEDDCAAGKFPLPNVDNKTLLKVIEFCKAHAATPAATAEALNKFDEDYMEPIKKDKQSLLSLVLAANYLNIEKLLNVTCQTVADVIRDMTAEQVREYFNIVSDYSPEEEAELRLENAWAYELNHE